MTDTPIFDALVAGPRAVPDTSTGSAPTTIPQMIDELNVLADFADGTRGSTLVPLADFMRLRMAGSLREAALLLEATQRVESGTLPGLAAINAERFNQVDKHDRSQASDVGRADELIRAAEAHISCALFGPDGSHDRYGPVAPSGWPWSEDAWHPNDDPRRSLAKAGALLAAAIDSLSVPLKGRAENQRGDEHLVRRVDHRST